MIFPEDMSSGSRICSIGMTAWSVTIMLELGFIMLVVLGCSTASGESQRRGCAGSVVRSRMEMRSGEDCILVDFDDKSQLEICLVKKKGI